MWGDSILWIKRKNVLSDNGTEYLGKDLSWNPACGVIMTYCEWQKSSDGSHLSCFSVPYIAHANYRCSINVHYMIQHMTPNVFFIWAGWDWLFQRKSWREELHGGGRENSCAELVAQKINPNCDIGPSLIWDTDYAAQH